MAILTTAATPRIVIYDSLATHRCLGFGIRIYTELAIFFMFFPVHSCFDRMLNYVKVNSRRSSKLNRFRNWVRPMFSIDGPPIQNGINSSQYGGPTACSLLLNIVHTLQAVGKRFLEMVMEQFAMVATQQQPFFAVAARPLEVLPDYYLNHDSAKRLWQDWRVLRRLFIRRDHSRDLLLQGRSGWLPIHGMMVNRQMLTITTDEGETELELDQHIVWLSRANPANTRVADVAQATAWCAV